MENNQQRKSTDSTNTTPTTDHENQGSRTRSGGDNEQHNSNRFSETAGTDEQHSESSKPDAANETLGTP